MTGMVHIRHVVYPDEPYGLKHAKDVMEAAIHVCDSLGVKGRDLDAVRYAALFHELGRAGFVADGDVPDAAKERALALDNEKAGPGVIAAVVERALSKNPGSLPYDDEEWQEEVVRLVLALNQGDRPTMDGDPRLVALYDAETMAEGRFWREKTFEHVRSSYQRLVSPWAQNKQTQVGWLKHYGIG
jgi:hypothetical protein